MDLAKLAQVQNTSSALRTLNALMIIKTINAEKIGLIDSSLVTLQDSLPTSDPPRLVMKLSSGFNRFKSTIG